MKLTLSVICLFLSTNVLAQDFFLNGNVFTTGENCFQMTAAVNGQLSSIYNETQIDLNEPFDMDFIMNFGSNPGGADGIVFILQDFGSDYLGNSGGNIGYGESQSTSSIGVEFDTWQNAERGDPGIDHVAIISEGSTFHNVPSGLTPPVQMSATSIEVEDGQDHIVSIQWDPAMQLLSVDFDCIFRTSVNVDLITDIFAGNNMVYWGFSSSTGGANNQQTVCVFEEIEGNFPEACIEPSTLTLTAEGISSALYTWGPESIFNTTVGQTVTATFTETTDIYISRLPICDSIVTTDTITIFVNDLSIAIDGNAINCISDTVNLMGTVNQSDNIVYNWTATGGSILSGSMEQNAIGIGDGEFEFTVTDTTSGCNRSLTFIPEADFTAPDLFSSVDGLLSCLNPEVQIEVFDAQGLGDYSYEWQSTDGVIETDSGSTIYVSSQASYTGIVTYNVTGCSDSIDVLVQNDPDFFVPIQFVEVPNVVSPNGDEINDEVRAYLSTDPDFDLNGKVGSFYLNIFNRWGQEVFSTTSLARSWYDIKESPGTYFYILRYSDLCDRNSLIEKKGSIQIIK